MNAIGVVPVSGIFLLVSGIVQAQSVRETGQYMRDFDGNQREAVEVYGKDGKLVGKALLPEVKKSDCSWIRPTRELRPSRWRGRLSSGSIS